MSRATDEDLAKWAVYYDNKDEDIAACLRELILARQAIDPRRWSEKMSDAWHRSIPDMMLAFGKLRAIVRGEA